jgi:hypothetical protein
MLERSLLTSKHTMPKLLLTYTSFIIACVGVIVAFMTATTYLQLAVAILLYPILAFFAYKVLPSKMRSSTSKKSPTQAEPIKTTAPQELANKATIGISDIDKRVFLKLIGGAGLFLFLFSLFNKKTEGLFFKNLPGSVSGKISLEDTSGNKINPAQSQPLDGYRICEIDDDVISFYGFTNTDGAWYIMKIDTDSGSFRYAKGDSSFPTHWDKRVNLNYDYFSNLF